jgi:glycogen(starch) synthase
VRGEEVTAQWSTYREKVRAGLAAADAVVAPTRWMRAELDRHYGAQARAEVIPNARAREGFRPLPKEPIVFCAGRVWDEAKNLLTLDRASEGLPWPVLIAGAPECAGVQRGKFNHSQLLGELEPSAVAGWLARAAIYALPARYEPFGLSVLEAAISGCALVLGDIPSLRETWADAALFVDPSNPDQLRSTLQRVIADPRLRRDLGHRARTRARSHSPARQVAAYLSLYGSMVSGRTGCGS